MHPSEEEMMLVVHLWHVIVIPQRDVLLTIDMLFIKYIFQRKSVSDEDAETVAELVLTPDRNVATTAVLYSQISNFELVFLTLGTGSRASLCFRACVTDSFSCSAAWRAEGQTRSAVNHTYEKTLLISWIRCSWTYWHLCWCCCSVFQFIASLGRCFAGLPFFSFLFYYLSLKWLKSSYRLCQDWEKQCSPTLVAWGPKVPRPCGRSCSHDSHDTGFYSDNTVISKVYLCFWVCMFPGLVAQEHLARGLLWPGRWFRDEQWVGA